MGQTNQPFQGSTGVGGQVYYNWAGSESGYITNLNTHLIMPTTASSFTGRTN